MPRTSRSTGRGPSALKKAPTGIAGLDHILGGGVPQGRPTLVCGAAGSGKSLLAAEFLVRGVQQFDEPGVLMTFDETPEDIRTNLASLGFDLARLEAGKRLVLDHVEVNRNELEENGEYDLEALFIRLDFAIRSVRAKRVVLDTMESLFSGLSNEAILRAELRRLFHWLKSRRLTTVLTGERGGGQLTRHGLEEYVSDCVIVLDNRVAEQISTRRLRIIKYRGSTHGTNEYPFLIDDKGISVLPITQAGLDYAVSDERVSTGIDELDVMFGGRGVFRGSTVLLTGTAGTGKTSVAAHFAHSVCKRGGRCLYFAFEESSAQIVRNMRSIGLPLEPLTRSGRLVFRSTRPTSEGLEMHLVRMHKAIEEASPDAVVIDPISSFDSAGLLSDAGQMLVRLVDLLRSKAITAFFVSLTAPGMSLEATHLGLSSFVDTWLLLRDIETSGERNRAIYVLKSRGMPHSNQVREFLITSQGIRIIPAYIGRGTVLTGTARVQQEALDSAQEAALTNEMKRKALALEHRRRAVEAQIATLQSEFAAHEEAFRQLAEASCAEQKRVDDERRAVAQSRHTHAGPSTGINHEP